jgi:hypothetical protein
VTAHAYTLGVRTRPRAPGPRRHAGLPSAGRGSAGLPSTGLPSTGLPSAGLPSTGLPSTGLPSTGLPSTGLPSAGLPSAGLPSAGLRSAGLRTWLALAVLAATALLLACPAPAGSSVAWPESGGFDDRTWPSLASVVEFEQLAASKAGSIAALKFVIVEFGDERREQIRLLDGRFYGFHDEWYWFRLVHGAPVPGSRERPLAGLEFASVAALIDWARTQTRPPLGLRFVDDRLYSDHFYALAVHRERRVLGLGTLLRFPARAPDGAAPRPALWGFELEYADVVDEAELERFFVRLEAALPAEIAGQLHFIARSPKHEQLVARLRARDHPRAARLTSYAELAVPGETEVYNPGLTAGRLRKLPLDRPELAARLLTEGDPRAIWMLPAIPDELPLAAGVLTAVAQTPLAHVNLLARNRGIPNAYLGGLFDDLQLDQLSRVHAPVVLLAEADGTLTLQPIPEADYSRWLGLQQARIPTLTQVDARALPYTLDLDQLTPEQVPSARARVGGKAAGFPLLRAGLAGLPRSVSAPPRPLAISIRAYVEHLDPLRETIVGALAEPSFARDLRVRYLLLEGRAAFDQRFFGPADQAWLRRFLAAHSPATPGRRDPVAALIALDGVRRAIRDRPLDPAAYAAITAALQAQFGELAPSQGLRFRSSSTVEDVEGFSGAGLYDSNTGFLDPAAQADARERKRDVEWAIKNTWASYWSWEAFEERRSLGIDHLAGNMAVLVHPRFDDPLERSNAVITLTLDRARGAHSSTRPYAVAEINVQAGALSVTNPPPERPGVLPEVDRVSMAGPSGPITIERLAASTEVPAGAVVLTDHQLDAILRSCVAIAELALDVENLGLDPARARRRITLDFELRDLAEGWPAYADGRLSPSLLVLKQVRSLDPGIPAGAESLLTLSIPRELLLHADRIERRQCRGRRSDVELIEVYTDPMASPDLGHARVPFLAELRVRARGLASGALELELDHRDLAEVTHPGLAQGANWSARIDLVGVDAAIDGVELEAGLAHLRSGGQRVLSEPSSCTVELLYASPDGLLRGLLGR